MRAFVIVLAFVLLAPLAFEPARAQKGARDLAVEATVLMRRAEQAEDLAERVDLLKQAFYNLR